MEIHDLEDSRRPKQNNPNSAISSSWFVISEAFFNFKLTRKALAKVESCDFLIAFMNQSVSVYGSTVKAKKTMLVAGS